MRGLFKIQLYNLPPTFSNDILLQLLGELTSPFLYIGRITNSDHSEGNVPVLNNLLKYSVKKERLNTRGCISEKFAT